MLAPPPLPRTLDACLRDLGSERGKTRASAVNDLVRHALLSDAVRAKALPRIEAVLKEDAAPEARGAAAIALGDLGAGEALAALLVAIEDPDAFVRQMALNAIGEIGDARAAPRLERALGDARPEVRYQAIIAYAKLAPKEDAGESIARAIDDDDDAVRYIALRIAEEQLEAGGALIDGGRARRARAWATRRRTSRSPRRSSSPRATTRRSRRARARSSKGWSAMGASPGTRPRKRTSAKRSRSRGGSTCATRSPRSSGARGGSRASSATRARGTRRSRWRGWGTRGRAARSCAILSSGRDDVRSAAIVAVGRARIEEARGALERLRARHAALVDEALKELGAAGSA